MATDAAANPSPEQRPGPDGASPNPPLAPVSIPDHKLLRRIGRGSYGEVWLARNIMGAYRAVKIVSRSSFDNQRPFERELSGIRKFEPISRSHEGLIDVLHVGCSEAHACFYYVMELGDDQFLGPPVDPECYSPKTLAKEITRRGKLTFEECLRLGLALSDALVALHKHGLVHRDIKPSNIIFVNGTPKLADIGLVADLREARSYVGTEGFIPPEGPGTAQADIYSLGKVLYEASTGKDRQDFPELPSEWDQSPQHDRLVELNEVILQACKSQPSDRYGSASDMQADLLVVANGKSVKRLKLLERRLARLKRVAGGTFLVLAIAGYPVYREWKSAIETRQNQVGSDVAYGTGAMGSGDHLGALPYFAEALKLDAGHATLETTHRLRLGAILAQCPKLTHLFFATNGVRDGQFSPDGTSVIYAEYFGRAALCTLQTHDLRFLAPAPALRGIGFSSDGRYIVTASEANEALVWRSSDLQITQRLPHPDKVLSARFSPKGSRLVTGCKNGFAYVWDLNTDEPLLRLKHGEVVLFAAFSHDGRLIVTTGRDFCARVWNSTAGDLIGKPLRHQMWITYAAFGPDDKKLVTASDDHKAIVWDIVSGAKVFPELVHPGVVRSAEFSPDGRFIVTACFDGTARLWSTAELQPSPISPVLPHGEPVFRAAFSADGRRILTTCDDGSVRVWDLAGTMTPPQPANRTYCFDGSRFLSLSNNAFQVFDALAAKAVSPVVTPPGPVLKTELSQDGSFVLSLSLIPIPPNTTNTSLQVWQSATGQTLGPAITISNPVSTGCLSQDGKRLAVCCGNVAQTWDVLSGSALSPLISHEKGFTRALIGSDARRFVTVSDNGVLVRDLVTGLPVFSPLPHSQPISFAAFSRDGSCLVTCCSDNQLSKGYAQVWDAATGRAISPPLRHRDGVHFAALSPDNRQVVTCSEDYTAILWEAVSGRPIGRALQHRNQVNMAAFSPDGAWVATVSADNTARVWSTRTGEPLTPPLRHLAMPTRVLFLPGGRGLATADNTGHSWVWDLPIDNRSPEDLLLLARLLSGSLSRSTNSLENAWAKLKPQFPSEFTTSQDEIFAWHELQARQSELEDQWFAAAFHLKRLRDLRPDDKAISERLARAQANSN